MKRTLHLVSLVPMLLAAGSAQAAPITIGNYTYKLTSQALSWTAAEAEAVADGGHLASIKSLVDNEMLANNFVADAPVWIGFYNPTADITGTHAANFAWSDGTTAGFADWQPGEPNNNTGDEYYTAMGWHYTAGETSDKGTWNDTPLNGSAGYATSALNGPYFGIIELPIANPAPEPGSILLTLTGLAGLFLKLRKREA